MRKLIYILAFLPLQLFATNYYVAIDGNDNNVGTITAPWATWGKALTSTSVNAGDTVFFRGGTYYMTVLSGAGYTCTRAGTSNNWIVYTNYPGEVPILDCSTVVSPTTQYPGGIGAATRTGSNYVKFIGLQVHNVYQRRKDVMTWCTAIGAENGFFIFENCVVYNSEGVGFTSMFYNGYPTPDGEHRFINCDAYQCSNPEVIPGYLPGNNGSGFEGYNAWDLQGKTYWINCRAWLCGDQGFVWNGDHYMEANGCWAFNNGLLQGDGWGFKPGWSDRHFTGVDRLNKVIVNCIAAYNRPGGMSTNESQGVANGMHIFNNLFYHNGWGDWGWGYGIWMFQAPSDPLNDGYLRIVRNNISYDNRSGDIDTHGSVYTHSNNSWDGGATITSADFKALPVSQSAGIAILSAPRKPDGSLPDLGDYFQLVSTSDAIDAGIDVGLDYKGLAPDLGPFEYDPGAQQSSAKNIISFTLPQQTGAATINTITHTVSIEVAHGTNVSSLTPIISVSAGATINPASGVARNFTSPVTYTVTAEDESTQTWTVIVTVAEGEEPEPGEGKWVPVIKNGEFVIRNNRIVVKYIENGN